MHENIVLDSLDKINPLVVDIKMNNRPCDKNRHLGQLRFGIQIVPHAEMCPLHVLYKNMYTIQLLKNWFNSSKQSINLT